MYAVTDLPERIAAKIDVDPESGCWLWIGCTSSGYGITTWDGRSHTIAHRVVYHLLADPTLRTRPGRGGTPLDHLCRVRLCVNPAHLELVTQRENTVRARGGTGASRFIGVGWHTAKQKWEARLSVAGRQRHLGSFGDEAVAAIAYDRAAELHYGERPNERRGLLDSDLDHDALLAAEARRAVEARGVSRFRGVCWHAAGRKWVAAIKVDGRHRHLGLFCDEVAAAITYDNAYEQQHGDRPNERLGLIAAALAEEEGAA